MIDDAITAEHVSKSYRLGLAHGPTRLSEAIMSLGRRRREDPAAVTRLQALDDVSFSIAIGEVMGIIGRNGAGKSTLLKVLSRVTMPDAGRVVLRGRVGSLLEVGTGFHPELTGEENAYLSGSILGMSRREIRSKLPDIVEFSELERFIDTPVKRYSSGMYMRLAFSVAAHLEPEILLVDEVLAVGDQAFQDRCLGRMGEIATTGRTVVFVSHNLGALSRLCERSIWMQDGRVVDVLPTAAAIQGYLATAGGKSSVAEITPDPTLPAQIERVAISTEAGYSSEFSCDDELSVEVQVRASELRGLHAAFLLRTRAGTEVLFSDSSDAGPPIKPGIHRYRITLPRRLLAPGDYHVTVGLAAPYQGMVDRHESICSFRVVDHSTERGEARPGVIGLSLQWHQEQSAT